MVSKLKFFREGIFFKKFVSKFYDYNNFSLVFKNELFVSLVNKMRYSRNKKLLLRDLIFKRGIFFLIREDLQFILFFREFLKKSVLLSKGFLNNHEDLLKNSLFRRYFFFFSIIRSKESFNRNLKLRVLEGYLWKKREKFIERLDLLNRRGSIYNLVSQIFFLKLDYKKFYLFTDKLFLHKYFFIVGFLKKFRGLKSKFNGLLKNKFLSHFVYNSSRKFKKYYLDLKDSPLYFFLIKVVNSNIFFTFLDNDGHVLIKSSSGMFLHSRKKRDKLLNRVIYLIVQYFFVDKWLRLGVRRIIILSKGKVRYGIRQLVRRFWYFGVKYRCIKFVKIIINLILPHSKGVRLKKRRRL